MLSAELILFADFFLIKQEKVSGVWGVIGSSLGQSQETPSIIRFLYNKLNVVEKLEFFLSN